MFDNHLTYNLTVYICLQMMWRLNFLVVMCCIVLDNSYMLYYICPLHTFYSLVVYGLVAVLNKYNESKGVIGVKFFLSFLVIIIVWEIPGVFEVLWDPFTFLLGNFSTYLDHTIIFHLNFATRLGREYMILSWMTKYS